MLNASFDDPGAAGGNAPDWAQFWADWTPAALAAWLAARPGWRSFDFGFLRLWGGRWLPDLAQQGRWWLWFTPGAP